MANPFDEFDAPSGSANTEPNPFDQFDSTASAPQVEAANPFDEFDTAPEDDGLIMRAIKGTGAQLAENLGDFVAVGRSALKVPGAIMEGAAELPPLVAGAVANLTGDDILQNLSENKVNQLRSTRTRLDDEIEKSTFVAPRPWEDAVTDIASAVTPATIGAKLATGATKIKGAFGALKEAIKGGAGAAGGIALTSNQPSLTETIAPGSLDQDVSLSEAGLRSRGLGALEELAGSSLIGAATDIYRGAKATRIVEQAKEMNIPPEVTEEYLRRNAVGLQNLEGITEKDYLTPESITKALDSRARADFIDRYAQLNNIARLQVEAGDIKGSKDVVEGALDLTMAKNLSQNGKMAGTSLLAGDRVMNYTDDFSQLVPVEGVPSLRTVWGDAIAAGKDAKELKQVLAAGDALNDYTINRMKIAKTEQAIAATADPAQKAKLEQELKDLNSAFASRGLDEDTATAIFNKGMADPAIAKFIEGNTKINGVLLDNMRRAGFIDNATLDYLKTYRPNYVSAKKVLEDVGVVRDEFTNVQGANSPLKSRTGRGILESGDVLENQIRNIVTTMQAVEGAAYKDKMFKFLWQLPDDSWNMIFRESKQDIKDALNTLKTTDLKKMSAMDITPHDNTTVARGAGNVTFNVGDGKSISLTVTDPMLAETIASPVAYAGDAPNALFGMGRFLTKLKRDAITVLDPTFSVRALQRESVDQMVGGKAVPFKDYTPIYSTVKKLAKRNIDKQFSDNYTYGVTFGEEFKALNKEEQIERFVKSLEDIGKTQPVKKAVEGTATALKGFAERTDMAPRALEYEILKTKFLKQGMNPNEAHAAALRLGYELGVNYGQQGIDQDLAKALRLIPFGQVGINGLDRTLRFVRNHPAQAAGRFAVGVYVPYKLIELNNERYKDPKTGIPYADMLSEEAKKDIIPVYGPWSEGANDYAKLHKGWVWGRMYGPMDKTLKYMIQQTDEATTKVADSLLGNSRDPVAVELKKKGITGRDVVATWADYLSTAASVPTDIVGLGTAADIFTNKDYRGADIVNEFTDKSKDSREANTNTSKVLQEVAKSIADRTGIEISPIQAQYVLNDMFPNLSQAVLAVTDATYDAVNDDYMAPAANEGTSYPMKRFMGPIGSPDQTGYSQMFYNMAKYVKEVKTQEQELMKAAELDPSEYEALAELRRTKALELRYSDYFDQAKKAIKQHYDTIDRIRKDPKFTKQDPVAKRDAINAEMRKIDNIAGGTIDYVLQTEGKDGDLEKYRHSYGPLLGMDPGKLVDMLSREEIVPEEAAKPNKVTEPTYDLKGINSFLKSPGLIEEGNINLFNRPQVKNTDGSTSTVRSMSFNDNGVEVLIPTVSDDGRIMSDEAAIKNYYDTGKFLGKFKDPKSADAYAEKLHKDQEKLYLTPKEPQEFRGTQGIIKPMSMNTDSLDNFIKSEALEELLSLDMSKIEDELRREEGKRNYAYSDSLGIRTAGIGFNMQQRGAKDLWAKAGVPESFDDVYNGKIPLSDESVEKLFDLTLNNSKTEIRSLVSNFEDLSEDRQNALINMHFQMGTGRLKEFKKMLEAINNGDFEVAAIEALDSRWAKQTPNRANRMASLIKKG